VAKNKSADKQFSSLKKNALPMRLQALEQRYLLDAASGVAIADALIDQEAGAQAETAITALGDTDAVAKNNGFAGDEIEALAPNWEEHTQTTEVVFIDRSVDDIAAYLTNISPTAEIHFLDSNRDGVEQIAEVLSQYDNVDAIHIISHGNEGVLNLGSTALTADSMVGEHADELADIGSALSAGGDILIYGCDFTSGEAGLEAAMVLGGLTGADIASSNDDTGHSARGGDWNLESTIGQIDTAAIKAENWDGLLTTSGPLTIDDQSNAGPTITLTSVVGVAGSAGVITTDLPEGSLEMVDVVWR